MGCLLKLLALALLTTLSLDMVLGVILLDMALQFLK